jgi:hypothetical protein
MRDRCHPAHRSMSGSPLLYTVIAVSSAWTYPSGLMAAKEQLDNLFGGQWISAEGAARRLHRAKAGVAPPLPLTGLASDDR